jgi:hypothetical protein
MSVIPLFQRLARTNERRSDDEEENDQHDGKQIEHRSSFHETAPGKSGGLRRILLATPYF